MLKFATNLKKNLFHTGLYYTLNVIQSIYMYIFNIIYSEVSIFDIKLIIKISFFIYVYYYLFMYINTYIYLFIYYVYYYFFLVIVY